MDYEDLVIQLGTESAGRYTVRVARSPAGETEPERFSPPLSSAEIDHLGKVLGRAARNVRPPSGAAVPKISLVELGQQLFIALFTDAVRNRYHESLGRVSARRDCGLRIRIEMGLGSPAMLAVHAIPWEYLRAPEGRHFLALSREISIARYLHLNLPADRPPVPAPLAVLVLAGEDLATSGLALARERHAIRQAWSERGAVSITFLPNPTLELLRDTLLARDYHVLHFMGHGGFDSNAGEGSLAFRDEEGHRTWISGTALAEQLRDRSSLRLVFLNACWTARAISSGPYAGVATALLGSGVPAVLAMQFPISDAAALAFSRIFYRRLARGDTIDAAVTEGRLAISRLNHPVAEWGTPVLFERLTSGRIVLKATRPRALWRVAALAGLLLLSGLALVWRTQSQQTEIVAPGEVRHQPTVLPTRPEIEPRAKPQEPGVKPTPPEARTEGVSQTASHKEQRPPITPRSYTVTPLEPVFVQELETSVSAEFSQIGKETYLTLHLTPPGSPTLHRAILGPTDVDLGQGRGWLQVLSIDWESQTVKLVPLAR